MSSRTRIARYVPGPLRGAVSLVYAVIILAVDRNVTYLAAAIAFYAFASIVPLVLLTVAVASFVGGEALTTRVMAILSQQLSSAGQESLMGVLSDTSGRGAASVVGVLGLAWGALKLFRGLDLLGGAVNAALREASLQGQ
jgi:membrane protein